MNYDFLNLPNRVAYDSKELSSMNDDLLGSIGNYHKPTE